jgi:PAS domain-containing protein
MFASNAKAEEILRTAIDAVQQGGEDLFETLDALEAPIYVTDAEGLITHYNQACIGFAGRLPTVGEDRWCVTWKLYTDQGAALPHDQCPMAVAIRKKIPVRGDLAVAERPDGTRVNFMPFPTPLLGEDGTLVGAVNMLVDVTDIREIAQLWAEAHRCRRPAAGAGDRKTAEDINRLAMEYDARAAQLADEAGHALSIRRG